MHTIWRNQPYNNVKLALQHLDKLDDDGTYNFKDLVELRDKYPHVFYPLYELQTQFIRHSLGEYFWNNHKAHLKEAKEKREKEELERLKKQLRDKALAEQHANDEIVKKRMGLIRFYLLPWMRAKERRRVAKIAAIETDLEKQFAEIKRRN